MIKAISPNINFTKKPIVKTQPKIAQKTDSSKNNSKINKKLVIAGVAALSIMAVAIAKRKKIAEVFSTSFNKDKAITYEKPKYLYHMTSKDAYDSIMSDGKIKVSNMDEVRGVYFSSADDLRHKYTESNLSKMLRFYGGVGNYADPTPHRYSGKIYILEVPVEKLDNDSVLFRNISLAGDKPEAFEHNWQKFKDFSDDRLKEHIKNPIEFLFKGEVSTDKITKVYEIDTDKAISSRNYIEKMLEKLKK